MSLENNKVSLFASDWQRIIGFLIDNIIIVFVYLMVNQSGNSILSSITIFFCYYFFMEAIFDGTFGKKILGLMVIDSLSDKYQEKRNIINIFIRTLCRMIPFDLISFFFTKNHQLWHDNLSETIVIRKNSLPDNYFYKFK